MIAIVDYGAGNLVSVKKAFDWLGHDSAITADPAHVAAATKVVLPGVGHFTATESLERTGLKQAIADSIGREIPFLGICVGMQWMFAGSEESLGTRGLGLFDEECQRFAASVKSPHVGWNELDVGSPSRLLRGVPSGAFVYFTHSFRAPVIDATVACCEYGGKFSAVVEQDRLFGVQFHPEKSGEIGLQMLRNFCEL